MIGACADARPRVGRPRTGRCGAGGSGNKLCCPVACPPPAVGREPLPAGPPSRSSRAGAWESIGAALALGATRLLDAALPPLGPAPLELRSEGPRALGATKWSKLPCAPATLAGAGDVSAWGEQEPGASPSASSPSSGVAKSRRAGGGVGGVVAAACWVPNTGPSPAPKRKRSPILLDPVLRLVTVTLVIEDTPPEAELRVGGGGLAASELLGATVRGVTVVSAVALPEGEAPTELVPVGSEDPLALKPVPVARCTLVPPLPRRVPALLRRCGGVTLAMGTPKPAPYPPSPPVLRRLASGAPWPEAEVPAARPRESADEAGVSERVDGCAGTRGEGGNAGGA